MTPRASHLKEPDRDNGPVNVIGIRREDKNEWERRVPVVPADLAALHAGDGIEFVVQPSGIRVFGDDEFAAAGAAIDEDLTGAGVVMAVKEIPDELFAPAVAYMFFSHTIKGQPHSMPMLRRILDVGATLIDYERIVDSDGRRLVHFGRYAGLAGMIDALWAYGQRWRALGVDTPMLRLRQAMRYPDLSSALRDVEAVGQRIASQGMDPRVGPLVVGVTGYGNVASGAMDVLRVLPTVSVGTPELTADVVSRADGRSVLVTVFTESDTVEPVAGGVGSVADYRANPGAYRSVFAQYADRLSILVNSVYWHPASPRLLTASDAVALQSAGARLVLVADLSCDILGGIEFTVRSTDSGDPVYVYDASTGTATDGFAGEGIAVLAVDNLPCELPADASVSFSAALRGLVPVLARTDFGRPFDSLALPPELASAVVAHRGELTPAFSYLREALAAFERSR